MVSTNDEIINGDVVINSVPNEMSGDMISISEEDFEKATKTFQLGKKNLFLNKYDESVNNIEEACKIYASKFGELDPQCAEVYFFYGKALLELARVENTVLGNALSGVPEDNEPIDDSRYGNPDELAAEEQKEISEKVISALCDNEEEKNDAPKTEIDAKEIAPSNDEKPVEGSDSTKETEAAIAEAIVDGDVEENVDEEEEGDDEKETEDLTKTDEQVKDEAEAEEISNLQRSWEMFELAKLIYSKNFDNDLIYKNKRIAECLLKLGEISIEQEIFEQAINDISESIKLQEAEITDYRDERMLAESFYQLALAQQFANIFNEAADSYTKSINIMKFRIEKLQGKFSSITSTDSDSELEKKTITDEILELEQLIPDMMFKLEEINEQSQQVINEAKEIFIGAISDPVAAPINGDVKDITNMLKSKRKVSSSSLEGSTKKTRTSDVNGECTNLVENAPNGTIEETTSSINKTESSEEPSESAQVIPTESLPETTTV